MSFLFFFLRKVHKASLTLCTLRKKKNKNDIIHEKLRVPPYKREGKLHGEKLRKFTETRAAAPRVRYAVISSQQRIQYYHSEPFCL